jgi:hypothetical protein
MACKKNLYIEEMEGKFLILVIEIDQGGDGGDIDDGGDDDILENIPR